LADRKGGETLNRQKKTLERSEEAKGEALRFKVQLLRKQKNKIEPIPRSSIKEGEKKKGDWIIANNRRGPKQRMNRRKKTI